MTTINAIFAQSELGHIGRKGNHPLLWRLEGDLKRFKDLTEGGALIMGRHTFESLPGILSGRPHYVITRTPEVYVDLENYDSPLVTVCDSLLTAIQSARHQYPGWPIWIIGGGDILNRALCICDRVYRTVVHEKQSDVPTDERANVDLPGPAPHWGRFSLSDMILTEINTHRYEVYHAQRPFQIYGTGN